MNKMTKQLFAAAVALVAFNACSDSNFAEFNPGVGENGAFDNQTMNSAVLTNANGEQISSVSADFGTYYLNIKTGLFVCIL